jgi:hypothetical protein
LAAVTALRAPFAWLFSCAVVAASPAANLVHVAVFTTPSFLITWYVPVGNTVMTGFAVPATSVLVTAGGAAATQEGGVNPGTV